MVGKMSVGICLVAMSPFLILVLVGSFKCDPSRWLMMPTRDIHNIVEGAEHHRIFSHNKQALT
jgi:hypothetical protein